MVNPFLISALLLKKLRLGFRLFPYTSGMSPELTALWFASLEKAHWQYKILHFLSKPFENILKKKASPVFNYETNVRHIPKTNFLYQSSATHLFKSRNKADIEIINNKLSFHQFCIKNQLPIPEKYGEISSHEIQRDDKQMPWHSGLDFFIKPVLGTQSKGILEFRKTNTENEYLIHTENRKIGTPYIETYLKYKLSRRSTYIIQERLLPPKAAADQKIENPPIIRILSVLSGNEIKILNPVLTVNPNQNYLNARLSNRHLYAIDSTNGRLMSEIVFEQKTATQPWVNEIPTWAELMNTVSQAHKLIGSVKIIGWDIAWSNKGFLFLEANKSPWIEIHQKSPFEAKGLIIDVLV